ncbi:hypothetical protein KW787_02380 [Candidatus Pacearchaeota archaeon]|nr:hypothetical protein [Candidatus Pacearchaeota archaeon]
MVIDKEGQRYVSFKRFIDDIVRETAVQFGETLNNPNARPTTTYSELVEEVPWAHMEKYAIFRKRGWPMTFWSDALADISLRVDYVDDIYTISVTTSHEEVRSAARHLMEEQEYNFEQAYLFQDGKDAFKLLKRRESVRKAS